MAHKNLSPFVREVYDFDMYDGEVIDKTHKEYRPWVITLGIAILIAFCTWLYIVV